MRKIFLVVLAVMFSVFGEAEENKNMNIHTAMMEATCKISGAGSTGTGFIIGKPDPKDEKRFLFTLVTANHVFASVKGDDVVLSLRRRKDADHWERIEVPIHIREKGKELWLKHADVDLAAIHVALPAGLLKDGILPMSLLLNDEKLREFEVGPGTELLCLGYPFGVEANALGFPILRSGKIASYPLLPTKETKAFLFDFKVFQGNSGGPVYIFQQNPSYGGEMHLGATIVGIIGVVTSEQNITQKIEQILESREVKTPLSLAGVIPASFIVELVAALPDPSSPKTP